jgi:putative tricarboxylic transport membrane protein
MKPFSGGSPVQSVESRDKLTVLILLAASTMFAVFARDLVTAPEAAPASPAGGKFLLAAAVAGSLIAVLMLLSPGKSHRSLRTTLRGYWPQLVGLGLLVLGYALVLKPFGFFVATSLFLATGFVLLGERRLGTLLLFSLPVAAALEFALQGVFGFTLHDPMMRALGVMA